MEKVHGEYILLFSRSIYFSSVVVLDVQVCVERLKLLCIKRLRAAMCLQSAVQLLAAADHLGIFELKELSLDFLSLHDREVLLLPLPFIPFYSLVWLVSVYYSLFLPFLLMCYSFRRILFFSPLSLRRIAPV